MRLAGRLGADIVSVDSMQVYREMDIGTAKPSLADRGIVQHHLIDLVDPGQDHTVAEFQREGRHVFASAQDQGRPLVVVGGSGLHFRSLVDPLTFPATDVSTRAEVDTLSDEDARAELLRHDPQAGDHLDLSNPRRVQRAVEIMRLGGGAPTERAATASGRNVRSYTPMFEFVALGLDPGETLNHRVETRFDQMLDDGLLGEVERLAGRLGRNASQAVGYKELGSVVSGPMSLEAGRQEALRATRALVKRQRTFFRHDPRIAWLTWDDDPDARYAQAADMLETRQ